MEARKRSLEGRGRLDYQNFLSKCVRNGLPEGGDSRKSSSMLQGKAEPVVGAGRVLENSMSGSRQDTSGAAEGPLAEPDCGPRLDSGMDGTAAGKRGPPSLPTPKSAGSGIMRGRALRTEHLNMDGFPRSLLKSRGMGPGARTGVQSPMTSFRSLLEGAISASGVHPSTPVQGIAESGLQHYGLVTIRATPQPFLEGKVLSVEGIPEPRKGERNFARRAHDSSSLSEDTVGDSGPQVSYSSLLQAQLGDNPVVRTDPSDCNRERTLRLNEEAHSPPVKLQSQSAELEGGFLALLNQTTRLLAPVAQRPSSPRADFMSIGGRASNVAVAGDASFSAEIASERDGRDSLRATAVLASAMPARSEDDIQRTEAVVERTSLVADSRNSVEDALGTSLPEEGDSPSTVNESRSAGFLSERVGTAALTDFSETTAVPRSADLSRIDEGVSPADVVEVRASFVVADSAAIEAEMTDAELFEELLRGLAIEESRFAVNASNMGAIDSREAAAASISFVSTRKEQGLSREEVVVEQLPVVVADSVSTDEKALDVQLLEQPSGTIGVDNSRSAHNVPKRDAHTDPSEASLGPQLLVSTRLEEPDLPAGVKRATYVVTDLISGDENASGVQALEEVLQEHALNESRSSGIVSERDAINLSGTAAVPASPVLVTREEDVPWVEVVVAGSAENDEKMSDAYVSDEPSKTLVLNGLRNPDIMIEGDTANLPEAAVVAASLVPISNREDVPLSESLMEEAGLYGNSVVHSDQGNGHLLSLNRSDGQVLDERIQSLSQRLELENCCADGRDGLTDAGTTLVSSRQAGLKQMGDANADSMNAQTILECSCKADLKEMEDVETDFVGLRKDDLYGVTGAATVVEYPRPGVSKQTEKRNALFVEERNNESCDAHMVSSTENLQLKSKADIDSSKAVLEKELETSKSGPVYSVPLDAGSVVGSSWQAVPKHSEDRKGMVGREEEDNTCHIPVLENLMCQHAGATEEHLMGGDDASGPQRSCVGSFDITSSTASPHVKGSLLIAECTRTDGGDHAGSRVEEKVEQDRILGGLEGSNEVIKRPEVEQHNIDTLADELPEMQMAILPFSETPAVNGGFVTSRTSCESEELPPSKLVVGPGIQNEEERVLKGHVGEIVDVATDSDNSGVPADQALSTSPGAISEGLRQVSVRDSDATASESLESVQVSGAEFAAARQEAGKEVQSPLVMKSKDRHSQDAGDLEKRHVTHHDDLENEEQPYASPLNGTMNTQLVGAGVEVPPFKKKGRSRAYNHEKALHGTGRPHLQPSGSKRKRQLQYAGNRWRRNRHIDPDQPVPVYIEGRDEGFEEADDDAFTRWLGHQDQGNPAPSPTVRKSARNHVQELVKPVIAIPSFRLVPDYEDWQQQVEKRRKVDMQQQFVPSTDETLMSLRTVRASDYDMDDEDERWLHAWNKRLARGGLKEPISEDKFEEMIECFERMYAQMEAAPGGDLSGFPDSQKSLAQSVPGSSLPSTSQSGLGCLSINPAATSDIVTEKPSEGLLQKSFKSPAAEHQPSDDCCICNGGEDDETNPVYTCKRCLIHVHQSCYGIREKFRDDEGRVIAPPSWCCRKCEAVAVGTALPNVRYALLCAVVQSCVLCRKRGGALKPTVSPRKWAHVACALYTNETFFVDPDAMEPIDGIAAVAARAQERQDRCGICGVKRGICSLCSVKCCRAPFHISCGVSQGASFELRQSKQKVVGVRCFCPRHARTTPMNSAPSPRLKQGHLVGSSTTSGATASATASGSISTASSMDNREERYSRLNTSLRVDGIFADPDRQGTSVGTCVADLADNVISVTGKGTEDAGRGRPNGLRFTLKRKWDESCTQVSEDGVSSDIQKKSVNGRGMTGDKLEAPGCKSIWHVVEPGQKLKKIKFKFGKPAQNQDPESSLTLFQPDGIDSRNPEAEKIEVMPAVGEAPGDAAAVVNDRDAVFVNSLSEDRFAKEVKELTIFGEAMKSSLAPTHIMREAFVYWRAKRAELKGSLLCELHHNEWSKSQSIFNKDPSDEGNLATGKLRVPLSRQPSPMSIEKMLEKAKELREQLHRVRSMAQMVVQREKIKCNQIQLALMIASAELNGAESTSEERHCVWCPSTKTLLKCGTCLRSFCFNCFKNRKGFGVKGWMAAAKQSMYSCKYCRELLSNVADLSSNLDPVREEIVDAGLVGTPVVPSGPVEEIVRTPVITCEPPALGGRGKGLGKGRDEGGGFQGLDNPGPGPASLPLVGGGVTAPAKGLGIGRGKGNGWTGSDNAGPGSSSRPGSARRGSENGANNQSKPSQFEAGLNKFLSITNDQMEHSSFETSLRRLKILRRKNKDASQEVTMTTATGIPAGDTAAEETTADVRASLPASDALETGRPSTANGDYLSPPASGPALLVYKKTRRMILSASPESPPSAYDFSDELNQNHPSSSPAGLEDGATEMMASPRSGVITKRLEIGGLERIED